MLHQAFIRNAAELALARGDQIAVLDSWTPNGKLRRYTKGDRRAKRLHSPVTGANLRRMHALLCRQADFDLRPLAAELDYTTKLILKNPVLRIATRRQPDPRMDGTITVAKTGPRTLLVTARNYDNLPGAISLQFLGHIKHGLKAGHAKVRVVACYGPETGLSYGLSAIQRLLSNRYELEQAIAKAGRRGGFRTPELDAVNLAGMPGSSERVLYEKLLARPDPGICRQPCWVLPELKGR